MDALINQIETWLKQWEGCKLTAYEDQGGRWTVGWGAIGTNIHVGTQWSQQQADERLAADTQKMLAQVKEMVKVPVNNNELTALVSFAFNVGPYNLRRSGLLRLLNREERLKAADQFLLWDKVGSYTSPGLSRRRQAEKVLFLTPPLKEIA